MAVVSRARLSCHCDSKNNMAAVIAREIDRHERIPSAPYGHRMHNIKRYTVVSVMVSVDIVTFLTINCQQA